jgi:long-subunit fatty acid transport protein
VRAGGWYEQSAIPPKTQGVNLIDGGKYGFGLGASYHYKKRVSVDLGFAQSFIAERKIRDSTLKQLQIPLTLDPAKIQAGEPLEASLVDGDVVGNGDFAAKTTMMSLGLTMYFGG